MSDITLSGASLSGETLLNKTFSFVAANHGGGKVGFENDPNTDTTISVDAVSYDAGSIAQPFEEITLQNSTLTVRINNEEFPDIASGVSYQWYRDNAVITGETGTNYALSSDDVGADITFKATYTNTSDQQVVLTTPAASNIKAPNAQGIYLDFDGSLPSSDLNYRISHLEPVILENPITHSLTKNGIAVPLSSSNSYAFLEGDVGAEFIVTSTFKDTNNVNRSASATLRSPIASLGETEGVAYFRFAPAPGEDMVFAYHFNTFAAQSFDINQVQEQLLIDGTVVETNPNLFNTYNTAITAADIGKSVKVRLSYALSGTPDIVRTIESEEQTIVSADTPRVFMQNDFVLSGTTTTPKVSFANPRTGSFGLKDVNPTYEWIVNGAVVSTRTSSASLNGGAWGELAEEQLNVGDTVTVRLTYTNDSGVSAVYTSNTLTIADVNTLSSVKLIGAPREGSTLTTAQLITDNSAGSISYEYYDDGVLQGTTTVPTELALGNLQKWKIKAKYTNSKGEEVVLESAEAPQVTNNVRIYQSATNKFAVKGVDTAVSPVFNAENDAVSIKWFVNGVEDTSISPTQFELTVGRDQLLDGDVYTAKVVDSNGVEFSAEGDIRLTPVESDPTHPIVITPDAGGFHIGGTATFSIDFPEDQQIKNTEWDSININGKKVIKNYDTTFNSTTSTFSFTDSTLNDLFDSGDLVSGSLQKDFLKKDIFSTASSTFVATADSELGAGDSGANIRFSPRSSKNRPLKNFHAEVYFKSDRGLKLGAVYAFNRYTNNEKPALDPTLAGLHNFSLYIDNKKITEMGTVPVTFSELEYDSITISEETILTEAIPQKRLLIRVQNGGSLLESIDPADISVTLADPTVQGVTVGTVQAFDNSTGIANKGYPFLVSWDTSVAPQEDIKLNLSITTASSGTRTFTSDLDFEGDQPVIHTRAASIKDLTDITIPSTTIAPGTPVSVSVILRDAIANYGQSSTIQIDKISGPGTFTQPVVQPSQSSISLDLNDPSVVTPGTRAAFFSILTAPMRIHLDNHGLSTGQVFSVDQLLDLESEAVSTPNIDIGEFVYIVVIDENTFTFAEDAAEAIANRTLGIYNHVDLTLTLTPAEDTVVKTTFDPGNAVGEEVSFRATITRPWGEVENTDVTTFLISNEDNVILLKGGDDIKLFKGDAYNEKGYMLITRDYTFGAPVWEPFGGATASGDEYAFPSSGDSWGGFANTNTVLEGLTLDRGIVVTFDGKITSGSSTEVDIIFKFERLPYDESTIDATGVAQSTIPSHFSPIVRIIGSDVQSYSFVIPPQTSINSYSSFLMYLQTQDTAVELTNFAFEKVGKELTTGVSVAGAVDTSQTGINTLTYNYFDPQGKKRAISKTRTIGILDQFLFWTDESITLIEGIPEGTVLYTAQATSSQPVTYSLLAGKPGLVINSSTGEVKFPYNVSDTDYVTDYESDSEWSIYVRADSGGQSITKQIVVNIENVDEVGPIFAGGLTGFNFTVQENVTAGSTIGQIGLSERDYENTSTGLSLTYSNGGSDPEVVINPNGTVELTVDTDAEVKTSYSYKAGAVDAAGNIYANSDGTPDYVEGIITVVASDDEVPEILGPKTIHIPSSLVNGNFIHDIILSDTDTNKSDITVQQIGGDGSLSLSVDSTVHFGDIYRVYSTSPGTSHTSRSIVLRVNDGTNQRVETLTFVTDSTMPTIGLTTITPYVASISTRDIYSASVVGGAEGAANNSSWNLVTGMEYLTYDYLQGLSTPGSLSGPFSINASTGVVTGAPSATSASSRAIFYIQLTLQDGRVAALQRVETEFLPDTAAPTLPQHVSSDTFLIDYPLSTTQETIVARLSGISDSPNDLFQSAELALASGQSADNPQNVYIHSSYTGSVDTAIRNFGSVEAPDMDYCLVLPTNTSLGAQDSTIPLRIKDIIGNIAEINFNVQTFSGIPSVGSVLNKKITNTGVINVNDSLGDLAISNDTYLYRVTPHATYSDASQARASTSHHSSNYNTASFQEEIALSEYNKFTLEMDDDTGQMKFIKADNPGGTFQQITYNDDKTTYTIYVLVSTTLGSAASDYRIAEVEVNLFRYYSVGFQEQYPNVEFLHMHRGDNANDIGTIESDRPQGDSGHYFIVEGSDKAYYKIENGVLKTKDATEADGSTPWHNHNQFASSANNNHTIKLEMYPVGQAATSQYLVGKSDDIDITFFKENIGVHNSQPSYTQILGYTSVELSPEVDVPGAPGNYKYMGNYASNLVPSNIPSGDALIAGATDRLLDNAAISIQPTSDSSTTSNPLVYIKAKIVTVGGFTQHEGIFSWQATNYTSSWPTDNPPDRFFFIEKNSSGHKFVNGGQITLEMSDQSPVGSQAGGQTMAHSVHFSALSTGKNIVRYPINPRDGSARPWPFEAGKTYSIVYASKDP